MMFKKGFISVEFIIIGALLLTFGIFASNKYIKSSISQAVSMDKHMSDVFGTGIVYSEPEPTPIVPEETPVTPEVPEEPAELIEVTIRYNAMGGDYIPDRDPGLYARESTTLLYSWEALMDNGQIVVEDGVLTYVDSSLNGDLVIGENVTTLIRDVGLNTSSSGGMALHNLYLPKTLSSANNVALNNVYLNNIYVSKDNPYYRSINGILYTKDGKTLVRFPKGRKPQYLIIAEGVEVIGRDAISYAGLKNIIMPATVTTINDYAFNGNPTIEKVYYTGTIDDWDNINISTVYNHYMTDATRYYDYYVADEDGLYNINEVMYKNGSVISGVYRDPIMQGYTFGGWYTDPSCTPGRELDLSKVTKDISAYAKWN